MRGTIPNGYFQAFHISQDFGVDAGLVRNIIKAYKELSSKPDYEGPEIQIFNFGQQGKGEAYCLDDFLAFAEKHFHGTFPAEPLPDPDEEPIGQGQAIWKIFEGQREIIAMGSEPTEQDVSAFGPGSYRIQKMVDGLCHGIRVINIGDTVAPVAQVVSGQNDMLPLLIALLGKPAPAQASPVAPPMTISDVIQIFRSMMDLQTNARTEMLDLMGAIRGEEMDADASPVERMVTQALETLGPALPGLLSKNKGAIAAALQNPTENGIENIVAGIGEQLIGQPLDDGQVSGITNAIIQALSKKTA